MQFIDLQAQYQHLKNKIDKRIQAVLDHGKYIMGPEVVELEANLAEYVGVAHAITCANGTDALTLAMMVLDIKEGDAVFCPTFTFFATAETIAFQNATPVFVDSNPDTFNICPINLEKQIQKTISQEKLNPKAIIVVDLFGLPADHLAIEKIAKKYNLQIIEDAAQGFGGEINGKRAGSFGDIATTSFFPAKPLGCYGDGGALFTNNDEYASLIKSYREHGKGSDKYDNIRIGMNSRLDTIQAAILLEKLNAFVYELERRDIIANNYTACLGNIESIQVPAVPKGYFSSWAQYTIVMKDLESREHLKTKLNEANIPTCVYYPKPLHLQTAFASIEPNNLDEYPMSVAMSKTVLSMPMSPYLLEEQQRAILDIIKRHCSPTES